MPLVLVRPDERPRRSAPADIELALLNNLCDAGLEKGERQFVELLRAVAEPRTVRLRFFSLPTIARSAAGRAHIASRYTDFTELPNVRLDGLIITGAEPRTKDLSSEAFWPQLAEVMDWAEHNTRSTIFSCLAAHAAVLHLDGIARKPLPKKCSGLFRVERTSAHPLLDATPAQMDVPHSRWNGLDAGQLAAAGYQILTQSPEAGVDTFVKAWRSLFVYLQGHPEYDAVSLRREYRRDIGRFLDGTSETYPSMPAHYFDAETEARLLAFAERAHQERNSALLASLPLARKDTTAKVPSAFRFGTTLFANWLDYLHATAPNHAV